MDAPHRKEIWHFLDCTRIHQQQHQITWKTEEISGNRTCTSTTRHDILGHLSHNIKEASSSSTKISSTLWMTHELPAQTAYTDTHTSCRFWRIWAHHACPRCGSCSGCSRIEVDLDGRWGVLSSVDRSNDPEFRDSALLVRMLLLVYPICSWTLQYYCSELLGLYIRSFCK